MRIWCFVLVLSIAGAGGSAFGQVATGVPPFSSNSGSSFDTVDNANLNVHFSIPIVTKAGRGLPFDYVLSFDSSIWSPQAGAWTPPTNWGWGGATNGATGEVTYDVTPEVCYTQGDPPRPHTYYEYSNFAYLDASGTAHPFRILLSNISSTVCNIQGPPAEQTASSFDGSGYAMTAHAGAWASVYAPNGDTILPPSRGEPGSGSITDANGNQLSFAVGSTTTFTDTLGVTALTVSGAGTPGSPVVYAYPNPSGGTSQVTVNYTAQTVQTNFGCPGITEFAPSSENLVSSIALPDGTSYNFTYDSAARVTSVTLPTGGTIHYAYSGGSNGVTCADGSTANLTRTTPDGTWTYTHTESGSDWSTTVQDPQGNQTVYQFQGIYETERKIYQGSTSGTLLETVDTCYNGASAPCTGTAVGLPITQRSVTATLAGMSTPAETVTKYTSYGLPTETDVYDYGPTIARKTIIHYASLGNNIEDRPSEIQVEDGSGNLKAQSTYAYDSHGNLTTLTENVTGSSTISRTFTYTANGMVATATDFNGAATTFSYGSGSCNGAFPTSIAQPLSLTSSLTWDCNGGAVTSVTDSNNQTTKFSFDEMWRPTTTSNPDGGSTTTEYTSATELDLYTTLTSSIQRHDEILLDSLGRTSQQILVSDPAGADTVATSYDQLGRVASVTNPYRGSPAGSTGYAYDPLGRLTSVTYADGNMATTSYSGNCVTTADPAGNKRELCSNALGEVTKVIEDPNGLNYETDYAYDALGNLTSVNDGGQTRTYNYDMLSRLTSATTPESGTTTYSYSGCSGDSSNVCTRTDARNITTTYKYDALNRLTSKSYSDGTATANFYYDESSIELSSAGYGPVYNTKGRLSHTTTTNSTGTMLTGTGYSYGPMGRIVHYWQCTPYNCMSPSVWRMDYNYDLAGDVTSWTHPAGFTITNTINAAQEITQITSSLVDATHPQYLAKSITYTPWDAEATLTNGCASASGQEAGCTDTLETYAYNNRMQPVMIELGSTTNAAADYCLVYNYYGNVANPTGCAMPKQGGYNGGNVIGVFDQDGVNPGMSHTAAYTYDHLNRLWTAIATGNSTYNLTFSYDRYGNMTCQTNSQTQGLCPNYAFNQANNEINTSGFTYDAAGDMTGDGTNTYQYNGEGRLISVSGGGSTQTISYDSLGDRGEEISSPGDHVEIVRGAYHRDLGYFDGGGGYWFQEFFGDGRRQLGYYDGTWMDLLHPNVLGSTAMTSNSGGGVLGDMLLYPWGTLWTSAGDVGFDEHFAGFTQVDGAALLYPAPVRRYDPPRGRWLTPDPLGGDITNPQSLNRYAYALNNPTTLTDPSGLQSEDCSAADVICITSTSPPPPGPGQCVFFSDGSVGCNEITQQGPGDPLIGEIYQYDMCAMGLECNYQPVGGGSAPKPASHRPNIIHWQQLQALVHQNDESLFGCDELMDCIIFKESSRDGGFDSNAVPLNQHGERIPGATARGLMEVTLGAAADVAGAPPGSAAAVNLHGRLFDPATNIQTGSRYLDILYVRFGGWPGALAHYGTGAGYADDVLNCVEDMFLGNVPGAMEDARGHP